MTGVKADVITEPEAVVVWFVVVLIVVVDVSPIVNPLLLEEAEEDSFAPDDGDVGEVVYNPVTIFGVDTGAEATGTV